MNGIDAAQSLTAHIPALKSAGYNLACRYYSFNPAKNLSATEARALSDAGFSIVSVFEARGDSYHNFNPAQGQRDAAQALWCAQDCGQPEGSAIYFAVDFDPTPAQISAGIVPYFDAVNTGVAGLYRIGAYGSGLVLGAVLARIPKLYMWLAQSRGWQGSRTFDGAHIVQGPTTVVAGISVDTDEADEDCGSWRLGNVVAVRPTEQDIGNTISTLQTQLASLGYYTDKIDGIAGPHTLAALSAFEHAG